jgi:hypothetical protein
MKKIKNEKRVVNLPKLDFDLIKKYCEKYSLDMVSWVTKNSLNQIVKPLPIGFITPQQINEYKKESKCPENWLSITLREIDDDLKFHATNMNSDSKNEIEWRSFISVPSVYGSHCQIKLTNMQVSQVAIELQKYGYNLIEIGLCNPASKRDCYKIMWM